MKKTCIIAALSCIFAIGAQAQSNVLTFGLRGGAGNLMPQSEQEVKGSWGPVGYFDFGYLYLAPAGKVELGLRTGLSVGYVQNALSGSFSHQFTNTDYEGAEMLYTTSAAFTERQQQLVGQVPLMLAMRANGFTLNVGAKLRSALWQSGTTTLSDPMIDAYYKAADIHVRNEVITGVLTDDQLTMKSAWGAPKLGVGVGAELGYEFRLGEKGIMGVQLFADYTVYSNFEPSASPIISVAPISDASNPVPAVTVSSPTASLVSRMNPMEVGLKLYVGVDLLTAKGKARKAQQEPVVINRTDTILNVDTVYIHRIDTVMMMDTVVYIDTIVQREYVRTNGMQAIPLGELQQKMHDLNLLTSQFESGKTGLPQGDARLDRCISEVAAILKQHPYLMIRVIGHTCNTGSHQTNEVIGWKRAEALKARLVAEGARADQIITETKAETEPIVPNDTPQNRQTNRRVEIEVSK